ncbi:MAG: 4'-phosphopantetheinyl transferase superfamily protein [Spirosomataceae bacterium]
MRHRIAEISLTHTARYIVVAIYPFAVGVDLEHIAPKIARIAPKFLSEKEGENASDTLESLSTYWCAKEALYKLNGRHGLSFKSQIFVEDFTEDDVFLSATIYPTQQTPSTHTLQRFWIDDFCGVVAI